MSSNYADISASFLQDWNVESITFDPEEQHTILSYADELFRPFTFDPDVEPFVPGAETVAEFVNMWSQENTGTIHSNEQPACVDAQSIMHLENKVEALRQEAEALRQEAEALRQDAKVQRQDVDMLEEWIRKIYDSIFVDADAQASTTECDMEVEIQASGCGEQEYGS